MRPLHALIALLLAPALLRADEWVQTFEQEFQNWATAHVDTFAFPPEGSLYSSVTMHYLIECPSNPGDCDPWDRLGHVSVIVPQGGESESFEIARVITPYDITGNFGPPYGTGPGSCTWEIDVSDYQHLLKGDVILSSYIESWMGNENGWLVTIDFSFADGTPELEPYAITKTWDLNHLVIGNPNDPVSQYLNGRNYWIDSAAEAGKMRIITTGHGQGNTDNAAEFSNFTHYLLLDFNEFSHQLWRDDCNTNPCSGQGGTWWYARANWCPGASVEPWDNMLPDGAAGDSLYVDYWWQGYENYCRPDNDDCVPTGSCPDCEFNYNGHTVPIYVTEGQLILYRSPQTSLRARQGLPGAMRLDAPYPNPFNPATTLPVTLDRPGRLELAVYDLQGRRVAELHEGPLAAGTHAFRWDASTMASGVYFARLASPEGGSETRKLLLVR